MTAAQEQALTTARRAGTIVLTGVERLGATITYPQFELALQGRRVLSCQNGNVRMRRDLPLFVGMLEDGRLDAEPIITSRYAARRASTRRSPPPARSATSPASSSRTDPVQMHTFPRPAAAAPQRRARAGRGRLPGLRRAGARLLPRARRGRAVGRRQVPGVPDLGVARARAAPGIADPAGADDRMIGVDVGGTFTDVVAVRDGRIEVTKVPSDASEPATAVVEGARRLGVRGQRGVQPREHDGPQRGHHAAAAEGRLPHHRGLPRHPRPRHASAARSTAQTDPAWRRSFGDAARPLVPRYLRRGVVERMLADGSELLALDDDQARRQLAVLRRCEVAGRGDLPAQRLRQPGARGAPARARPARCSATTSPVSISSETSPLAKEYARASTTVVDVLMKLIFGRYSTQPRRRPARARLRRATSTSPTARRRCCPGARRCEKPFRIVFAGPAAGTISSTRLGAALGDRQPAVRRRRRHLDRRLARRRRRAVRQRHLRDRARPGHQRAVDRGLERRRRRRQHRVDLAVGRRPRRARERGLGPRPGVLRARRHRADADRRLPADGHPRPGRLRRRRDAPGPRARAAGVRGARHAALARAARVVRLPHRRRQHRRGGHQRRGRATASTRATSRSSPTAPPARCCCPPRSTCCRSRASSSRRTPGLFSAHRACSAPTSSTTRAAAPTWC